jgi:hypothetical protein
VRSSDAGAHDEGPLSFVGLAGVVDLNGARLVLEAEDKKD